MGSKNWMTLGYLLGVNFEAIVLIMGGVSGVKYLDLNYPIVISWAWLVFPLTLTVIVRHYIYVIQKVSVKKEA